MPASTGHLIEDIYEAAILPELWPAVLERIAANVKAVGGVLFAVDSLKRGSWTASPRLFGVMQQVVENFADRNIRPQRALAKRHAGFLADLDFLTEEEKRRDPLYAELLKPSGLAWACGSVIPVPSGDLLVFDFERTADMGPFHRTSLDALDTYRPHLARAGLLASRLQLQRAEAVAAIMQALGLPGAVVGRNGRVLAMNALMEKLAPQVYTRAHDRLTTAHRSSSEILNDALIRIEQQQLVRSIAIQAYEDKPALVGHVIPIAKQAHDIFSNAAALFVATPLTTPVAPDVGLLCGLFDLTPTEDRVARAIAQGHNVESSSTLLSVSQETVRSHLKRIMAKTGTARQAELVRLLAGTTSLPLPGKDDV